MVQGRPAISDFCVDCFREGLEPPEAGPKTYGSYCRRHAYARQNKTKSRVSQRATVRHGRWSDIPENAQDHLASDVRSKLSSLLKLAEAYKDPIQVALLKPKLYTEAFEWSCVEVAIQLGRQITTEEEDEIIELYGGDRGGVDALAPKGPGGMIAAAGKVLLPNPKFRQKFRAELRGGPTTVGEPTFTEYYVRQYGTAPPPEIAEEGGATVAVSVKDKVLSASPEIAAQLHKQETREENLRRKHYWLENGFSETQWPGTFEGPDGGLIGITGFPPIPVAQMEEEEEDSSEPIQAEETGLTAQQEWERRHSE